MKFTLRIATVLAIVGLFLFSCQKYTETNQLAADETFKSSNQGTAWLQANATTTQTANTSPTKVNIDFVDGSAQIDLSGGDATVNRSGDYLIIAAPQVGYTGKGIANFRCWLAVNDVFVPNSNVLTTLTQIGKDVIVTQGIVSLEKGDRVSVYMASNKGAYIERINPPEGVAVPALIFTMYAIN